MTNLTRNHGQLTCEHQDIGMCNSCNSDAILNETILNLRAAEDRASWWRNVAFILADNDFTLIAEAEEELVNRRLEET